MKTDFRPIRGNADLKDDQKCIDHNMNIMNINMCVNIITQELATISTSKYGSFQDTMKVRIQCSTTKISMAKCFKDILSEHGPRGLYRGMLTPLAFVTDDSTNF